MSVRGRLRTASEKAQFAGVMALVGIMLLPSAALLLAAVAVAALLAILP